MWPRSLEAQSRKNNSYWNNRQVFGEAYLSGLQASALLVFRLVFEDLYQADFLTNCVNITIC
jgi:hypothetical protein